MNKLLLFDIDGTLVNLDGIGLYSLAKTFKEIFNINEESIWKINFYGKTDPKIYEDICKKNDIPLYSLKNNYDKIQTLYLKYLRKKITTVDKNAIITNVLDFLNYCKTKKNIYLGLLTGNIELGGWIKISPWNLNNYFEFGAFGSDNIDRNKLVDIALAKAKEKFKIKFEKENVFVIGDTPLDIKCAQKNKVISIAVATGNKYSIEELKKYNPDYLVNNLSELKNVFI